MSSQDREQIERNLSQIHDALNAANLDRDAALDAANARADEAYLEPRYCKGCSIKLHTETRRADEAEREVERLRGLLGVWTAGNRCGCGECVWCRSMKALASWESPEPHDDHDDASTSGDGAGKWVCDACGRVVGQKETRE